MILQYNMEYIIFKYKSQSVDYNKMRLVEYGSSQY